MRAANPSARGRFVPAGTYTGLFEGSKSTDPWMTDTPDELEDHFSFIHGAHGDVLITGLGLGVVTRGCLINENVRSVTVVEISPDVITLVAPWLRAFTDSLPSKRLTVIQGDAMLWTPLDDRPGFSCTWHDIWQFICETNMEDFAELRERLRHWCPPATVSGWSMNHFRDPDEEEPEADCPCGWEGFLDDCDMDPDEDTEVCPSCGEVGTVLAL